VCVCEIAPQMVYCLRKKSPSRWHSMV